MMYIDTLNLTSLIRKDRRSKKHMERYVSPLTDITTNRYHLTSFSWGTGCEEEIISPICIKSTSYILNGKIHICLSPSRSPTPTSSRMRKGRN